MLLAVKEYMPDLLPFAMFCYADHTPLCYQQEEISSQRGVQQGDALGPLLFCLALHKITASIKHRCSFVPNYMDDVTNIIAYTSSNININTDDTIMINNQINDDASSTQSALL